MYNHQDPYAGQYPPPLPVNNFHEDARYYHQQQYIPPQQKFYTPPFQYDQQQQQQQYDYFPPPQPQHETTYTRTASPISQYHNNEPLSRVHTPSDSLDAYLRREREEYLKNREPIKSNQVVPQMDVKPTTPRINKSTNHCCCCYNPAITCCSFFWLLVSCSFCAAGIALIIASKVFASKCSAKCTLSACNTLCDTVLQNGFFYGGIVVAGLACIAIIWRLIMWTCAGYSQRH